MLRKNMESYNNQYLQDNKDSIQSEVVTNTKSQEKLKERLFSYLPISLFGSVMGLSAMSIAWYLAKETFSFPESHLKPFIENFSIFASSFFGILAILAFIVLFIAYGLKILTSFQSFKQEFQNPITRPFFGTFAIACLLLPIVLLQICKIFLQYFSVTEVDNIDLFVTSVLTFSIPSLVLWGFGIILMLSFAIHISSFWICHKHEITHITPAWIVPVVGLLDIPLALPFLFKSEFLAFQENLTMLCLAVGLFFAIILIPLILARIIFFEKLPDKLMPTLFILLAPFGVGISTYAIAFGIDKFATMLFYIGLFLFFALLPQIFKAYKCCPFRVTWWAISFPFAAMSIAALKLTNQARIEYINGLCKTHTHETCNIVLNYSNINFNTALYSILSLFFIISCTLVFLWLIFRTLRGILNGELQNMS